MTGPLVHSLMDRFNAEFLPSHNTRLVGGFSEPVYLPPEGDRPGEIRFTHDYIRSVLHEVAHWCVAGVERRKLPDFGYWYRPDGRNASEQTEFFGLEIKPQALELAFTEALGIPFEVSCDNLTGSAVHPAQVEKFEKEVRAQLERYRENGFPNRAGKFIAICRELSLERSSLDNIRPTNEACAQKSNNPLDTARSAARSL